MAINQFSHNSNEPLQVKDLNVSGTETIVNIRAGVGSITSLSGTAVTYTTGNFGKIGIGITVPSKALDVRGDIKLTGGIYDNVGSSGTSGQILISTGTGITWSSGNSISIQDTQLINANVYPTFADVTSGIQSSAKVSSNYLVYNPFQGRIGIGTTQPANTFQVGTGFTVSSSGIVSAYQYYGDGSNLTGLVPNTVSTSSTTRPQFIGFSSVSSGVNTSFATSSTFVFVPSGIGSLGIGTTAPTNTLHVQGNARITGGIFAGSGNTTGTNGQFLQSTGTSLQWVNSSASVGVATTTSTATQFLTFVTGVGATSTLGIGTAGSLSFSPSNRTLSISSISIGALIRDAAGIWQPTDGYALKYIQATNRVEWGPVVSSVPVSGAAGISGQVQFNNAGGFAGASFFNYDISTGNVGIGTSTSITSKLTVQGDVKVSGVVTATTFSGDGSRLTGINTGSAAGSSGQVQFNNTGIFSGAQYFNYNPSTFSVGIGTSSPTGRLSVASTSSGNSLLLVNDNTNDGSLFRVNDNSGLILFDVDAGGTIIMPIVGNVGIGSLITTPTSKLQVGGGGSFAGDMYIGGNAIITGILTARVAGTVTGAAGTSGQVQVNIGGSFTGAPFFNYDAANVRVGIGTSIPTGRLSIANTSTGNSLLLVNDNLSDGTLFRVNDNTGFTLFDVDAGGAVIFNTYGNVGIGSTLTTASSKLQVDGNVLVSGIVTAATFSGQVNAGIATITTLIGTGASITNINSTGIITARTELDVGIGGTFATITSSGLGIGTNNPTAKLQVVGAANTSLLLVNENLSDGSLFRVADSSANILFDVDANGTIIAPYATVFGLGTFTPSFPFQVGSGTTGFVVSGLGSVGIGTDIPLYRLTVATSGATVTPGLSNVIADFTANTNSYSQINTRNASSGTNASTDIIATADSGTDTTNYIDLGINNSGYSVAGWTINGALDGYLYTSDTNLSIGAAQLNKYVSIFAGGTLAANEVARFNRTGVGIGTTNPTTTVSIGGTLSFPNNNIRIGDGLTGSSITSGVHNFFAGSCAGRSNNTGSSNNFFGFYAGRSNTSGCYNNYFGICAGRQNTTGCHNNFFGCGAGSGNLAITVAASHNNFFGAQSGQCITTGCYNNFFGRRAGFANTNGRGNNFFGRYAGIANTNGSHNNFFGFNSGCLNTSGNYNNFFGCYSGSANTTGSHNTFFGRLAGRSNTTGSHNTFFGFATGCSNTTGSYNTFFGCAAGRYFVASNNTFIGGYAGRGVSAQSTGINNIAIGSSAGCSLTTGSDNNFLGRSAGRLVSTGTNNNFFGNCAGCATTGGSCNNFFGCCAGAGNQNGSNNNFFGNLTGFAVASASHNNFFGQNAGRCNTGSHNNFFGNCAGCQNTTGNNNNFFGQFAGLYNTTGTNNTFIGCGAGRGVSLASCITGSNNVAIGNSALLNLTSGIQNIAIGQSAGQNNSTGCYNNFFGLRAGRCNTTANGNNYFGGAAGQSATGSLNNYFGLVAGGGAVNSGSGNNFFGNRSGCLNSSGSNNNFFGQYAGQSNTTGSDNIAIGRSALNPVTAAGSNNIAIGSSAGSSATPGLVSLGSSNNTIVMGNFNHTNAFIKIAWTVTSDERDKGNITPVPLGLSFVQKLTPIEYNWIDRDTQTITDENRRYGFSAQNILENETNPSVLVDTRDPEHLKLRESMMIPVLVNAIKELSLENRELKNRIIEIERRVGISSGG